METASIFWISKFSSPFATTGNPTQHTNLFFIHFPPKQTICFYYDYSHNKSIPHSFLTNNLISDYLNCLEKTKNISF
ncbi:hypothetical protein DSH67_02660 [Enterococcus faecalis]|nr:hypothetical protein [Enterococcus faecalis]